MFAVWPVANVLYFIVKNFRNRINLFIISLKIHNHYHCLHNHYSPFINYILLTFVNVCFPFFLMLFFFCFSFLFLHNIVFYAYPHTPPNTHRIHNPPTRFLTNVSTPKISLSQLFILFSKMSQSIHFNHLLPPFVTVVG